MALRLKRRRDLTEAQRAALSDIQRRHKEEHDALSSSFYQKKHSVGVSPEEQAAFDAKHNAIHMKYEQEMVDAGLYEEVDELAIATAKLNEMVADINLIREGRGLRPLELAEKAES